MVSFITYGTRSVGNVDWQSMAFLHIYGTTWIATTERITMTTNQTIANQFQNESNLLEINE